VENRPGGNTIVGTTAAFNSAPDGYTLLIAADQNMTINPAMAMAAPYDVERDFAPISLIALNPTMLVVRPDVQARNVQEFVALAKQKPKTILYGSSGPGSIQRLAMEQFAQMAGIELVHVPYRGSNETVAGLLGGNVHTTFNGVSNFLQLAEAGKVRVLAAAASRRSQQMPQVPTVRESGVPGLQDYEALSWFGIVTHASVPGAIREKIEADLVRALKTPEIEKLLQARGFELVAGPSSEFKAQIKSETAKWRQVIAKGGITAD
jgi:tripartite-type tricarboxylate transporter receptor subunit TctC